MVVTQLVKHLLLIPKACSSNSSIGSKHLFTVNCNEKTKIKKKEAGNGPFIKIESFGLENTPKQAARDTRWKYCTLICCKIVVKVRTDTLL